MILAAGEGRRLRPITDKTPKALVEVGGVPMLERIARRLKAAGAGEIIVNTHHLADQVEAFLAELDIGVRFELSREAELLDTGGGLRKAARFFNDGRPFFLHNVDIVTDLDLKAMMREHEASGALATLAVHERESRRGFLFDEGRLCGWDRGDRREWAAGPKASAVRLPFAGVHVVSPSLLDQMTERGAFSIGETYLRLAGEGRTIAAWRADGAFWAEIGSPERLERARRLAQERGL